MRRFTTVGLSLEITPTFQVFELAEKLVDGQTMFFPLVGMPKLIRTSFEKTLKRGLSLAHHGEIGIMGLGHVQA